MLEGKALMANEWEVYSWALSQGSYLSRGQGKANHFHYHILSVDTRTSGSHNPKGLCVDSSLLACTELTILETSYWSHDFLCLRHDIMRQRQQQQPGCIPCLS